MYRELRLNAYGDVAHRSCLLIRNGNRGEINARRKHSMVVTLAKAEVQFVAFPGLRFSPE
jgi:hypothetical protein